MTKEEICEKYNIPSKLYDKYEFVSREACCEESALDVISMLMTLYEIGFDEEEADSFAVLYFSNGDSVSQQLDMLTKKREEILSKLHERQKQLDNIDFLRYKLQKQEHDKLHAQQK